MLWAIDVGNTHTVFGLHDGVQWCTQWRLTTSHLGTEDELASHLQGLCQLNSLPFAASVVAIASVNPFIDESLERLCRKYFHLTPLFLRSGQEVGLEVRYQPPSAVGADRIANALGALALVRPPIVIVDFGTATTFDAIDSSAAYIGGAILPGPESMMETLSIRTAKLPKVPLQIPPTAIGQNTAGALQSGMVLGYVGAIEGLLDRFLIELGPETTVLSTGGLGEIMAKLTDRLGRYEPTLTLDGLRIFASR